MAAKQSDEGLAIEYSPHQSPLATASPEGEALIGLIDCISGRLLLLTERSEKPQFVIRNS